MPLIVKETGGGQKFVQAPPGAHSAICCDVVDIGVVEVTYPGKPPRKQHKIRIVWQINENMPDGKPFIVNRRYTASLHEKSGLRKDLESWRGRSFTTQELEGFDVEKLIGVRCLINAIEQKKGTDTYTNVVSISRLPKGMMEMNIRDYVRVQDRPKGDESPEGMPPHGDISDDDVPF